MRRIIHIDMDAFFASVEQLDDPALSGKPVVVGSASDRGVIAAASYEARKFGVRSAMASNVAKRLCPDLVFVNHRMKRYKEVSDKVFEIFHSFSPIVEALSVDEAFLEATGVTENFKGAIRLAGRIKEEIGIRTGLSASAGISYNKFLAKLASDMHKPDGLCSIEESQAEAVITALPIESFYGIGKVTAEKMHRFGIHTGKELKTVDLTFLTRNFGKAGRFYFEIARGIDDRPVEAGKERKSVGAEITFDSDLTTQFQIIAELYKIEKDLWKRVEKHGKTGRTITLKVKWDDFTQITKSHTLTRKVTDFSVLHTEVAKIRKSIDFQRKKVRLMGVAISNFDETEEEAEQLGLWIDV